MTADAAHRPRDGSARSNGESSFAGAVPMTGTGDGPRPDSTTFAPAAGRPTGGRDADERRRTTNRAADDDTTQ